MDLGVTKTLGLVAAIALLSPAVTEAQTPPSTLTAESPGTIRIKEGTEEAFSVVFTVDPPLSEAITIDQTGSGQPNAVTARLTDLRSSEGDLFSSASVESLRLSSGREVLEARVKVDPGDGLDPSDYAGQLIVSGTGVNPGRSAVTLKLAETPPWTELTRYLVAAVLLALGVGAGALLTWLNGSGSKLVAAERRLAAITLRTDPLVQWLPDRLETELAVARTALLRYDASGVNESLEAIPASDLDSVIGLGQKLRAMDARLDLTEATLASRQLPATERREAHAVVSACRTAIAETVQETWPTPNAQNDKVSGLGGATLAVQALIELFATDKQKWSQAGPAASLFRAGRQHFPEAVTKVGELVKGTGTADEEAAGAIRDSSVGKWLTQTPEKRPGPPRLRLATIRRFNLVAGILVAAGVILVGLTTVFDSDQTFNDIGSGVLLLIGWGLGVQTVGVTLAQLGNTLVGDRTKLSAA